ncbi:MAG: hypothetical protein ABI690_02345 [Chloroflexota bacterium]
MTAFELFALAEHNYLRMEAMDLFERCLTEGCPDYLNAFIEQQIIEEPPRIDLLQQVAEDLHQRLLGLREYHFDVRNQVLQTLQKDFQVNLSTIAPPDALEQYHLLSSDQVLRHACEQNPRLTVQEQALLRKVLDSSLDMAAQLHDDKAMTESILDSILDWTDGLSVTAARHYGLHSWESKSGHFIH